MTLIISLPEEVLSMVFNKLNDLNSLAECRLACKAWSIPAERAMLGSTITISSNAVNKTRSLYTVLKKNPEKAYLIKHLNFDYTNLYLEECIPDLLQLALAPSIESITGLVWKKSFIDTLTDIVERSPNKLDRLKTLTLLPMEAEPSLRLALHCRSTIQTIHLRLTPVSGGINWNFVDRLNEFINLTSLTLDVEIGTIADLDRILSKCPQLQSLSLRVFSLEGLVWDQQRIERNANLRVLSIPSDECSIEMLGYLLYKYPSIQCTSVNAWIDNRSGREYILQVPRLLQKVPQRELIYSVSVDVDLRFMLMYLIKNGYKITIVGPVSLAKIIYVKVDC